MKLGEGSTNINLVAEMGTRFFCNEHETGNVLIAFPGSTRFDCKIHVNDLLEFATEMMKRRNSRTIAHISEQLAEVSDWLEATKKACNEDGTLFARTCKREDIGPA